MKCLLEILCLGVQRLLHISPGLTVLKARHTALLHLNPDPKPICQTLSPFLILPLASLYANSYHTELLDVFPNLYSVILDGSICQSLSFRFFFIVSKTALPPA